MKKETIPPLKIEMPSESREEKEERKRREKASSLEIFITLKISLTEKECIKYNG